MKNPKILVICETNFVYSVILAQDRNCGYLLDLASENKIDIAIPKFSFIEVRGKIGKRFQRREDKLRDIILFLNELMRSEYHKRTLYDVKEKLKQLYINSPKERNDVLQSAEGIKSLCTSISHNAEISYQAFLRSVANLPPYKDNDRQIYESILNFTKDKGEYDLIIFYTSDKEDFDHKELRDELEERGIEVYFDSGNVVQRVMDMV
ncbi:MAG: PIN domain-containing protein [Methanosarcinales archaeon]